MNAAAVSSNETMYNFMKLVDAARQRNISGFDLAAAKQKAVSAQSKSNTAQVSAFQQAFTKSKPPLSVQPATGYQLPKVTRTKILGNFFDSYA
jgi:hypothetical protein